ncbi:MAG: hypothetical protein CMF12_13665 [Idiomarina sp.]|uniref:hypothetical protein n=1 Tax=Idiomarina sp. TaxID=1874361 RepID=UPI000C43AC9C|nr:hypothetical protein [Idiomarina sp.]MBT43554.1 hypothetical protein [Idiomarina sp.]
MDFLFIYNAEAETDVQLHFCSLTAGMKKRIKDQTSHVLFDDLLHSTFQLRSDLVPSDYESRKKVIDSCVGPANTLAYELAHCDPSTQQLANKIVWGEDSHKTLQEIYQKGVTKAVQNKTLEEGNVVIISLGLVDQTADTGLDVRDESYRFITVSIVKDSQENYQKYRGMVCDGLKDVAKALSEKRSNAER